MAGEFVTLSDYQGHFDALGGDAAFGSGAFARTDVVSQLNKALDMRKALATNAGAGNDGSVLIPQSLETTLQVISYQMKHLKLWNMLAKRPAYAIHEEFDALDRYGDDLIGFMNEGALPPEDNSKYSRHVGQVKFLGTTRSVTHPMTLVRTIAGVDPIVDREDRNGTMQILRTLETALFFGDDDVNDLSIKGLYATIRDHAPSNVIDMRGKPITDKTLEDLDQASNDRYGVLDMLFCSNRQKNNLSQLLFPNKRLMLPVSGNQTSLGMTVNEFVGNNSTYKIESHQFIRDGGPVPTQFALNAPAAPANFTAVPRAAVAGDKAQLAADTYDYVVTAFGNTGEGMGAQVLSVAVAANSVVELSWDQVPGAVFYRVYRKDYSTMTQPLYMAQVKRGAGAQATFTDTGKWLPGCSMAFGLMLGGDEGMAWKQLAPLMKLPLATVDTKIRWAILLYGLLQVYQPLKQFVLINVGNAGINHDVDIPVPEFR